MRTADVYVFDKFAGALTERDDGRFVFVYDESYLHEPTAVAVSSTIPDIRICPFFIIIFL